jgi:hypothetical protein
MRRADRRQLEGRARLLDDIHEPLGAVQRRDHRRIGIELGCRERRQRGLTGDGVAALIDEHRTVGIAVMGDPQVRIRRAHRLLQQREMLRHRLGRAGGEGAIGRRVDRRHLTAEPPEQLGCRQRPRPIPRIDHHMQVCGRDRLCIHRP